jgi:chorismate mutase
MEIIIEEYERYRESRVAENVWLLLEKEGMDEETITKIMKIIYDWEKDREQGHMSYFSF